MDERFAKAHEAGSWCALTERNQTCCNHLHSLVAAWRPLFHVLFDCAAAGRTLSTMARPVVIVLNCLRHRQMNYRSLLPARCDCLAVFFMRPKCSISSGRNCRPCVRGPCFLAFLINAIPDERGMPKHARQARINPSWMPKRLRRLIRPPDMLQRIDWPARIFRSSNLRRPRCGDVAGQHG